MRPFLFLTALLFMPLAAAVSQDQQQVVDPRQLDSIADSLLKIQGQLAKLSEQMDLQTKVGTLTTLDNDMSTLSSELQRSLDARTPLEIALVLLRANSENLALNQQAEQRTKQDSLDQLNLRIEELRRTLAARKSQSATLEKLLNDRLERGAKTTKPSN